MGLLKMRKRKIAESAADLLEPGEAIEQMVMTQTGRRPRASRQPPPRTITLDRRAASPCTPS